MEDLKVEMVKVVSWNVNTWLTALDELVCMDADVALLQEVPVNGWRLLARVGGPVAVTPHEPWLPWQPRTYTGGRWWCSFRSGFAWTGSVTATQSTSTPGKINSRSAGSAPLRWPG